MPALRADTVVRIFAIAAACLWLLAAAGPAGAADGSGGAGLVSQPLAAPGGAFAGRKAAFDGHIDGYSGPVTVAARRGERGDFVPLGTAQANAAGDFSLVWTPPKSGRYSVRVAPAGAASAATTPAVGSFAVYRRQKATWYGPESYGSRTACGIKLTRSTLGVAHKTLPCGTQVEFFLRGRRITVPVIDRGPYANGAIWDLTLTAMRQLGSSSTETLGALPLN
jgi:hypothetical protein